jgi:inosine-uridine nucleoside N-ribohydrolase
MRPILCAALAVLVFGAGAARAAAAAVPLIVDTDIFSDADDAGALATAFGLQLDGEANVLAVMLNKPTTRSAVAADSWRCVAAIDSFYGAASVPIGSATPATGSSVGDAGFIGPCGALAPASAPAPQPAVDVYQQVLSAQPDDSVVIVSTGYLGNLADLLGANRALVAQKVKRLVVMGGGYPTSAGEANIEGDSVAAQDVADNWPTKIVWSGFEVGVNVRTGWTVSQRHPSDSPVRVALEAFQGPDEAIYSWDLTAVYHAVRPADTLLSESAAGTNAVDPATGSNTFTSSASGTQRYLQLGDGSKLGAKIEALLDTYPCAPASVPPPPGATGPAAATFAATGVTATGAHLAGHVDPGGDDQTVAHFEYGTTTRYGRHTPDQTVTSETDVAFDVAGLQPGTTYHYRTVAANRVGADVGGDKTFTTASGPPADPSPPPAPPASTPPCGAPAEQPPSSPPPAATTDPPPPAVASAAPSAEPSASPTVAPSGSPTSSPTAAPVPLSALRLSVVRMRSSRTVSLRLTCSATCTATVTVRRGARVLTRRVVHLVHGRATIVHVPRPRARRGARPTLTLTAATPGGRRAPTRKLAL